MFKGVRGGPTSTSDCAFSWQILRSPTVTSFASKFDTKSPISPSVALPSTAQSIMIRSIFVIAEDN